MNKREKRIEKLEENQRPYPFVCNGIYYIAHNSFGKSIAMATAHTHTPFGCLKLVLYFVLYCNVDTQTCTQSV